MTFNVGKIILQLTFRTKKVFAYLYLKELYIPII